MTNPKVTVIISVYNEEKYLKKALDSIKEEGAKLVITVDCGITAIDEVNYENTTFLYIAIL